MVTHMIVHVCQKCPIGSVVGVGGGYDEDRMTQLRAAQKESG